MSKIDDAIEAIETLKEKIAEAVGAAEVAMKEAEDARDILSAAGADANAESLGACRETLGQVASSLGMAVASTDTAVGEAEQGRG